MKKFLVIAAMMAAGSAQAGTPQWTLSESAGTVNILRAGVSKIAISGGSLAAGDVISTGRKSRAVLVRGQEYVVVSPNSRLRISEPKQSGGVVQFFEEIGNVLFRIDKKTTPHFGVKTPYLAAVVKGTTFSVTVSETGTAVQVTEGAVQVSTLDGGASQLLSPGMIGIVNQDQQFRLTIAGAETKTIDSPNAPAGSTETPEPMDDATLLDIASSAFDGTISAPVLDTPVSLSALTGGLITNGVSTTAPVQMASLTTPIPNFGIGNSGAINSIPGKVRSSNGSSGSSASSAGGNSSSNAQGNSNAGGNGNVNADGNANVNLGGIGGVSAGGVVNADAGGDGLGLGVDLGLGSGNSSAGGNSGVDVGVDVDAGGDGLGLGVDLGLGSGNSSAGGNSGVDAGVDVEAGGGGLDLGVDLGLGSGNPTNSGNGNTGSGMNYGGDQPDGTCNGVPNCASGPNPNGSAGADSGAGSGGLGLGVDLGLGSDNSSVAGISGGSTAEGTGNTGGSGTTGQGTGSGGGSGTGANGGSLLGDVVNGLLGGLGGGLGNRGGRRN